jgi:hypothetical protein
MNKQEKYGFNKKFINSSITATQRGCIATKDGRPGKDVSGGKRRLCVIRNVIERLEKFGDMMSTFCVCVHVCVCVCVCAQLKI